MKARVFFRGKLCLFLLVLIACFLLAAPPGRASVTTYDGEWSGETESGYPVYFAVTDSSIEGFSIQFYVSGTKCNKNVSINSYFATISGNSFTISDSIPAKFEFTITGTFSSTASKNSCSGTWYYHSLECDGEGSGTWSAEGPPPGPGGLWENATDLGGGWKWLDWFGYFNVNSSPWIYHQEHLWLYPFGQSTDSISFWDPQMSAFWWTGAAIYPFCYRFSDGAWLWYLEGSSNPRWFYNYSTLSWESN